MVAHKIFNLNEKKNWADISEIAFNGERSDMQCRERFCNILDPNLDFDKWTLEQDQKLLELV
jgi:hypothetical protein